MKKRRPIRGKLFVFEGPDGVGKSTLCAELAARFAAENISCTVLSFPGREEGTIGKLVYEIHHNPSHFGIGEFPPASLQTLHIAAHLDAIERRIKPLLEAGTSVLLDRFWWSTWVYGTTGGINRRLLEKLIAAEGIAWGKCLPDAVILLRRDAPIDRSEQLDYWRKLGRAYEDLALREARKYTVFTVANIGTVKEVVEYLWSELNPYTQANTETRGNDDSEPGMQLKMALEARLPGYVVPEKISHLAPARPTAVFNTYWRFAAERQAIFYRRLAGESSPWTTDPILATYKFTNSYRASDRASQYLIRHVIYRDDLPSSVDEVAFRILLFKLFNKIETWELLENALGPVLFEDYTFDAYDRVLTDAMLEGKTIYSGAYIMPSGIQLGHTLKHRNHLELITRMMADQLPHKLADAKNMHQGFDLLRSYPTLGDFLAYQLITDINYSDITQFSEMEFVVPGPGARDGLRKCFQDFGGLNEAEAIRLMADIQDQEFARLGLQFQSLWGRRLQLIDCQNLFCEVDKYARVAHPETAGITGRTRIKQKFRMDSRPLSYWYPPKWGINEAIGNGATTAP